MPKYFSLRFIVDVQHMPLSKKKEKKKEEPVNLFVNGLPGPQFHSEQDLYHMGLVEQEASSPRCPSLPHSPLRAPWIDRSFEE
jgi:hypothetical protein